MRHLSRWKTIAASAATGAVAAGAVGLTTALGGPSEPAAPIELTADGDASGSLPVVSSARSSDGTGSLVSDPTPASAASSASIASPSSAPTPTARAVSAASPASLDSLDSIDDPAPVSRPGPEAIASAPTRQVAPAATATTRVGSDSPTSVASAPSPDSPDSVDSSSSVDS
jgi:hypothetical protein